VAQPPSVSATASDAVVLAEQTEVDSILLFLCDLLVITKPFFSCHPERAQRVEGSMYVPFSRLICNPSGFYKFISNCHPERLFSGLLGGAGLQACIKSLNIIGL
jgi:hypothetical protein